MSQKQIQRFGSLRSIVKKSRSICKTRIQEGIVDVFASQSKVDLESQNIPFNHYAADIERHSSYTRN